LDRYLADNPNRVRAVPAGEHRPAAGAPHGHSVRFSLA